MTHVFHTYIYFTDNGYSFINDEEPDRQTGHKVIKTFGGGDIVGYHPCKKSAIYEDTTGFWDELHEEEKLPDAYYIVTYFEYDPESKSLMHRVDYHISKADIIWNVLIQKYAEGAEYFLNPNQNK